MAVTTTSELIGNVLDEKYLLTRELGRGGMGSVYLATHLGTDRPVALKLIAPQFMREEEFVERFRREAKAAGRLYHPNVVNVTDFGFARVGNERVAYLVMEYLEGCTLADILGEERHLPLDWVIDILEQTCSAVDQAHRLGVIHRDLKPDNIWLVPNRRGGYTVKVLDFGLAKLADAPGPDGAHVERDSGSLRASSLIVGGNRTQANNPRNSGELSLEATTQIQTPTDLQKSDPSLEALTQIQTPTAVQKSESSLEAVTQIQTPTAIEPPAESAGADADQESVTRIMPPPPPETEAATRIQQPAGPTDTLPVKGNRTVPDFDPSSTAAADGLTRLGSILGTPLYMSPEQCASKPLDARSDIYSLGVIAYQLLAGEPPFRGQIADVMKQHIEIAPPPLREKRSKIPRKMASLVMAALEKDPEKRPSNAQAFASSIRASAESTGRLFRRALSIYTEHFPKFFRISLLLNLPVIFLAMIEFTNQILNATGRINPQTSRITNICLSILIGVTSFLANSVLVGVIIRMVTQLFLAPLRPLDMSVVYKSLRKRIGALMFTGFISILRVIVGMALCVIPGIWMFILYSLSGPVVMMEDLKGRAALKRSKILVKRSLRTAIGVAFVHWVLPAFIGGLIGALFGGLFKAAQIKNAAQLTNAVSGMITPFINIVLIPVLSMTIALLYLKMRELGGETLSEILSRFEEEDVPLTKWRRRMRERLYTSTPSA